MSKSNQIKDIPFFVLSAGEGNRMKNSGEKLPKSLIPLSAKLPGSLEMNILALENLGVKYIAIALGAYFREIDEALKRFKDLSTDLVIVDAKKNYKKGPLYSFLSGEEVLIGEEVFGLIPADTIFHPFVFDRLLQLEIDVDSCYLFYYLKNEEPSNKDIVLLTDEQEKVIKIDYFSEILKDNQGSNGQGQRHKILIPLLLLNGSFFLYAKVGTENTNNPKTKVIDMLIPYVRSTKKFIGIEVSGANQYFVDLDTPEDFQYVKDIIS